MKLSTVSAAALAARAHWSAAGPARAEDALRRWKGST